MTGNTSFEPQLQIATRPGNCSPNGPRAKACANMRWPWRPAWSPAASRRPTGWGLTGEARGALVELYSTTALLHDFDYERHPTAEEHPFVGVRELERLGWPEELRTAILGHAQYSGVPRTTHLAKVLFACDELAGFLTACALVKPTKSIADVEVASVQEKDEGQGLCPRRPPRRHHSGRSRARRRPRRAHRLLH